MVLHEMLLNKWIKDRLKEKSTYHGLTLLSGTFGLLIDPALLEMIGTGVIGVMGLIETVSREAKA